MGRSIRLMNHEDNLPRAKGSIIRMSQTPRDTSTNNVTTQRLLISYPEHGTKMLKEPKQVPRAQSGQYPKKKYTQCFVYGISWIQHSCPKESTALPSINSFLLRTYHDLNTSLLQYDFMSFSEGNNFRVLPFVLQIYGNAI